LPSAYAFAPGSGKHGLYYRLPDRTCSLRSLDFAIIRHTPTTLDDAEVAPRRWVIIDQVPDRLVDILEKGGSLGREDRYALEQIKKIADKTPSGPLDAAPLTPYTTIWKEKDPVTPVAVDPVRPVETWVPGKYIRPNGEVYYSRKFNGSDDVESLREAVTAGLVPYLYGDPGTGKTALIEAAFGERLETLVGDADTDSAAFVGSWVQVGDHYEWVDGPLLRAMKNGHVMFIDEVGLIDARVISIINPLLDGRGVIEVQQNPTMPPVFAAEGFALVFAGNPNALGVRMSEALISRLSFALKVTTDYDMLEQIGVRGWLVDVADQIVGLRTRGEIAWAPQTRELLACTKIEEVFGKQFAANALIGMAPSHSVAQVTLALQAGAGLDGEVLSL